MRQLYSDADLKNLFERIKKFIRKYKKSPVLRKEFTEIQTLEELPKLSLIKEIEVLLN